MPLYAVIQEQSARPQLSRMIASNNVVNAAAIVAGAALTAGLAAAHVAPATVLAGAALANLAVAVWIVRIIPRTTVRALFRWYFTTFHGVTVTGLEHLPPEGDRCVVVVNHQSFLDGCFVAAFLPGTATFAVNVHIARRWWARPFLAAVHNFPSTPRTPSAPRPWSAPCATASAW